MMMADSIRNVDDDYVRRLHSSIKAGKLHKGHSIAAASASIPSKYQTIVTDNADRKGFLSKSRRFNYDTSVDDHPGPGNYVTHRTMDRVSASYSRKGTGGFASKSTRAQQQDSTFSPGPVYAVSTRLSSKSDFNRGASSAFHKPIAQKLDKQANSPAPNQYDVLKSKSQVHRKHAVSAQAAFRSQTQREIMPVRDSSKRPAPWQYHVKDDLVKDSVKIPFSSFKSTTKRGIEPKKQMVLVPGPGAYHPYEEVESPEKTLFPRKHYLCISAPAMALPEAPTLPGPGAYDLVNYQGPGKHYMSGSVFVSNTSRWNSEVQGVENPGPAHYHPMGTNKQSFIYNSAGRWL